MRRYVTIGGIVVVTLFAGSMAATAQPGQEPEPAACVPAAEPAPRLVPEPDPPAPRMAPPAPPAPRAPAPPAGATDPVDPVEGGDPADSGDTADFTPVPGIPDRAPRTVPAPGSPGRAPVAAPDAARAATEQEDPEPEDPEQEDPAPPAQDDPAPVREDPEPVQDDPEPVRDEPVQDEPEPVDPAVPGDDARDPGDDDCATPTEPDRSAGHATSAAAVHDWGEPNRVEEFDGPLGDSWNVYDGPGHAGKGRRTPDAVSIDDGIMTITGDSSGATAGMAWNPGQKYGRWEGRVKAPASDESYNALLLLWPDAEDFPVGGEIDFMEMLDHTRQMTNIFLHYGANNDQVVGEVNIDATEWHNWAVEWTPTHVAAFVDGKEWWRTTDVDILPPRAMHLCIQLDWFPQGGDVQESYMYVDWVKQYSLDAGDVIGSVGDDLIGTADGAGEAVDDLVEGVTDPGLGIADELTGPLTEGGPDPVPARRGLVDRAVPAPG